MFFAELKAVFLKMFLFFCACIVWLITDKKQSLSDLKALKSRKTVSIDKPLETWDLFFIFFRRQPIVILTS